VSIYKRKQKWKLILLAIALIIISGSLWYTNILVKKISTEERKKVELWAGAIQKKANLVKYTNELFNRIKQDERKKVQLWADATRRLVSSSETEDFSFILKVVTENNSVPVILVDDKNNIISHRNLDSNSIADPNFLKAQIEIMKASKEPIEIEISKNKKNYLYYKDSKVFSELKDVLDDLVKSFISEVVVNSASAPVLFVDSTHSNVIAFGNMDSSKVKDERSIKNTINEMESYNPPIPIQFTEGQTNYIYYRDSLLLTQLKYYPVIQFGVIGLFLFIAYSLFSTSRKAEQNQVWIGLAKETAHQLGTPLSSLMAWHELLKERGMISEADEIEKDIKKLQTITERFSKIGSVPVLHRENLNKVLEDAISYMKSRTSQKVKFIFEADAQVSVPINVPLFEWVIENLLRNAVDSMEQGGGKINISVSDQVQFTYIDITDSGKGIPKSKFKTVFEPGFTTKKRGWGLGLSLAKRIIESYHGGKIFVKSSEPDKGTTFRIVLSKAA
jgi:two-component sensor histidine kinase